jgi:electron transport complex protein RnfD
MENLIVATSPHIRTKISSSNIMRDVIIALMPATVAAAVLFGLRALLIIGVTVASAVLSEFLFNLIVKKDQTVKDLSAVVTGLILALSLPLTATVWQCILGAVFAIVVVKCLFGGIGANFANPAATARVMLLVSFATSIGGGSKTVFDTDLTASATPLEILKGDDLSALPSITDMLLGNRMGAIGETCIIAIVLGGIYLIARKVIKWQLPVIYMATMFVFALIVRQNITFALYELLSGALVFAGFFMITDYSTTPLNARGKMLFAFLTAILTGVFRFYSKMPGGVSYAILIMNILSPYIEKLCAKAPLGKGGKK